MQFHDHVRSSKAIDAIEPTYVQIALNYITYLIYPPEKLCRYDETEKSVCRINIFPVSSAYSLRMDDLRCMNKMFNHPIINSTLTLPLRND